MIPDASARDYASLREAMLALARERLPDWTDHSPADPGVLLIELMAWMGDQLFYHQDRIAEESYLSTAVEERSVRELLRLIGVAPRPAQAATGSLQLTFDASDRVRIARIPAQAAFQADVDGEAVRFCYLGDLQVVPPEVTQLMLPVVQVDEVIRGRVVGTSDGRRDQRVSLGATQVLVDTLDVQVAGEAWTSVRSLSASGPDDRHVCIETNLQGEVWLCFGDGTYGAVPRRGPITADFLRGGGARGNIPAGTTFRALTSILGLRSVSNPRSLTGGADPEPLAQAARRGPLQFRATGRAVTASDYEAQALALGARKAQARPGTWNRVRVVVLLPGMKPGDASTDPAALAALQRGLQERAPISVAVDVSPPRWAGVQIKMEVDTEARYDPTAVHMDVRRAVKALYDPEAVPFGAKLHLSKIYEAAEAVRGVASVHVVAFSRADRRSTITTQGTLELEEDELPYVNALQIGEAGDE